MKRLMKAGILTGLLCLMSLVIFCGCGEDKSGGTLDEPDITAEYLAEDYAEQLKNDGASTMLGSVTIEETGDDAYTVHIEEKEVVANSSYDEGYYIADTNVSKDVPLGIEARIACMQDDKLTVTEVDDFIANFNDSNSEESQLYTIYMMGDSADLILATDPKSVETK